MTFIPLPGCETTIVPAGSGYPQSFRTDNPDGTYQTRTYDGNMRLLQVQEGRVTPGADGGSVEQYVTRVFDAATCRTTGMGTGTVVKSADGLTQERTITSNTAGRIVETEYLEHEVKDQDGVYHFVLDTTEKVTEADGKTVSDRWVQDWGSGGQSNIKEHTENGKVTDRSASFTDHPGNPAEGNQSTTSVHYHADGGATITTETRDANGHAEPPRTTTVDKEGNPIESPLADDDPRPRPAQPNPLAIGEDDFEPSPEFQDKADSYLTPEAVAQIGRQEAEAGAAWLGPAAAGRLNTPEALRGFLSHEDVLAHALDGLYPDT
ncbi:hypothetical protein [Sphaerisporangium dianthi]|uniref:YD repeat-containing protein n=1 Tax=Sphaerisporangium dianthi TaxID=1436120 RepID=A0ABV9CIA0_9ACTN